MAAAAVIGAWLQAALQHHRDGRLDKAARAYKRVLQAVPNQPDALNLLGVLELTQGRAARSRDLIGKALKVKPGEASFHCNLGNALGALGLTREAKEAYLESLKLSPKFALAHFNLGLVYAKSAENDAAVAALKRAVQCDPSLWQAHLELARSCYQARRYDEAIAAYRAALALDDRSVASWNELGRSLRTVGELEEARTCFERAVAIDPAYAEGHRNLALLGAVNRDQRQSVARLLARNDVQGEARMLAGFAMGKMLDDAGEYDAAFAAYAEANALALAAHAAAGQRFSPDSFSRYVDGLIATEAQPAPWQSTSAVPVFVLGAPRSGTSLVEQIAATHPAVHGAGELRTIGMLHASGDPAELQRASRAYLGELTGAKPGAIRGIDKMPDNIFHIATILVLFPKARIIWCRRDPLDNLLSCYFQRFASGNVFSYDLVHCAHRLADTARLERHWAASADANILQVDYEALVADLDSGARRIIEFLGVPWDARCLAFHETARPVATASGWQVRQPLYQNAVGRWRNYQRHLEAVRHILG